MEAEDKKNKKKVVNLNTPTPSLPEERVCVCLSLFLPPLVLTSFCCYLEGFVLKSAAENDACRKQKMLLFFGCKDSFYLFTFQSAFHSFISFYFSFRGKGD